MSALCCFRLGEGAYAVPVTRVQEVLRSRPIAAVPLAPEEVLGLLNRRGRLLPVLDLRLCMGMPPGDSETGLHVIVTHGDELCSLLVDAIDEVVEPGDQAPSPVPPTVPADHAALLAGVLRTDTGPLHLLDVDRLLDCSA